MIRTEELSFHVGTFGLDRVTLDIPRGKYFVLLGPPGAGKSIFLECLCGLRRPDGGRILIDGRDVTHTEPRLRGIGYVPQDYALFSHLNVRENITFGLRARRIGREEAIPRIEETTQLLRIGHLLPRRIAGLSGGEQQRVALARALVLQPHVLLLDEPVCALDEATRQEVCGQLLRIQRQLELTVVHVSHNLEEAFSVADYAAILHEGRVQQAGPMDELLRRPNCEFVARFVRAENIFSGHAETSAVDAASTSLDIGNATVTIPGRHAGDVMFMIRPEQILVLPEPEQSQVPHSEANHFPLVISRWRDCGAYFKLELSGVIDLVAHVTPAAFSELKDRPRTTAVLPAQSIHVLSAGE